MQEASYAATYIYIYTLFTLHVVIQTVLAQFVKCFCSFSVNTTRTMSCMRLQRWDCLVLVYQYGLEFLL